jgi:UPF0716 protein FxsA
MALLVVLFLVVPILELYVIVQVAGGIGVVNTIGLLILVSAIGAWLVKREGLGVLRRVQDQIDRGGLPHKEVLDGFLILGAGALLLTPGFLSDVVGILLLLPPVRAAIRGVVGRSLRRRAGLFRVVTFRDPRVTDVEGWEDPPHRRPGGELGP